MKNSYKNNIKSFVEACHKVARLGLLRGSSGNMSCRIDSETALLTQSGSWLGDLTSDQVAICCLKDGKCVNGKKPTVESKFHLGVLEKRPDVNVVLHFHSPYATVIACGDPAKYNYNVTIEIPLYVGTPAVVEFSPPGSIELSTAIIKALKKNDLAIMRNHGLVTVGKNFNDAMQKACAFESACQVLVCQKNPRVLSSAEIKKLICG